MVIGWLINRLYDGLGIDLAKIVTAGLSHENGPYLFEKICAVVLLLLIVKTLRPSKKSSCEGAC